LLIHVAKLQHTCTKTPTSYIQKCQLARPANIRIDDKVLNDDAIMVLMGIFTTFVTTLVFMANYKPVRQCDRRCVS
jgi:hypothetical protein